ncbi:pentatricopeptide repeat-containing protein At3g13880-like [Typha angustifolia]|uniref:pentatricopeptide repeat-containing protein At3g13880-like n=1 Tax=Typha angustifolia TaxID=59011 RepID=UPI003C2FA1A8
MPGESMLMISQTPERLLRVQQILPTAQKFHHLSANPSPNPTPIRSHRGHLVLEPSTYKDLLQLSAKTQSLILGKLIHSHMIRTSYRPGIFLHNNLLSMYLKCGNLVHALKLFDRMPVRDVVTWNSLMSGYSQIGCCEKALDVFRYARSSEVSLDRFSYAGALGVCGKAGDLKNGRVIHGLAVVCGLAQRAFLINSLIDMYSKCGMIDEVRMVFDRANELDEVSWNLLLSAYIRMGWPEVAMNILVWMHRSGVKLNSFSLGGILKACSGFSDSEEVRRMLHGCVLKVGLDLDLFVGSAMLDMYAKNGGLEEAIKAFECIPNPSVVVFNAMIAGFSRLGNEPCHEVRVGALGLFSEMLRRKIRPSKFTIKSVLEACKLTNKIRCGKQIHAHVILNGLQEDEFIGSALITLYSNSCLIDDSLRCFHLTPKQDVFIWTSMITAYAHNEHFEGALHLFNEFLSLEIKPDQFMISSLMNACSDMGVMRSGQQIQCYSMKIGLDQFTVCGNSQIKMYTNTGNIKASVRTFQDIGCLDNFTWSAMISSYALHGHEREALILFQKMEECKVMPDQMTFVAVLTACKCGGLVDEGLRYYENMMTYYGLAPNMKHKLCVVDLLGRAGRLADAESFVLNSGFENDPVVWHTLLRACHFHGDMERSIGIGERLMMLDPFAATSYTLLYNLYLDVGKISLAMRTRGLMRERGVTKESAVSWIEIGASVHSFAIERNFYRESNVVYQKLEQMLANVKQRTIHSGLKILELEYQSNKWNESLMNSHDELLAVALGMSILPASVSIRVMKNQVVCRDCHTMLKLFSESEKREIVLRDPIRFHHFNSGSCSCGDYW